jgi:hypothetical protein
MDGIGFTALLASLPAAGFIAYAAAYLLLRTGRKLAVAAGGWHAESVDVGGRIVATALGMFIFFQPLMRAESALIRLAGGVFGRAPREQGVSDVVVEVVPML